MPKNFQINEYSANCEFGLPLQVKYFPHMDAREAAYQYFKKVVGVHKIEKTAGVLSFSQFAHSLQSIYILQYSPISLALQVEVDALNVCKGSKPQWVEHRMSFNTISGTYM